MVHLIYGKGEEEYQCPGCGGDTSNLALTDYLCTFETCNCDIEGYPHLIEAKWHRKCYDQKVKDSCLASIP
jgi:hypothetical protein